MAESLAAGQQLNPTVQDAISFRQDCFMKLIVPSTSSHINGIPALSTMISWPKEVIGW